MEKRRSPEIKKPDPNILQVQRKAGESDEEQLARLKIGPHATAVTVVESFSHALGSIDFTATYGVLKKQTERVNNGDMSDAEAILSAQATTLNSIFTELACRAARQNCIPQFEINMRFALRAQNQARLTLETLSKIKNPPVVFAKQANIAQGHQQVNNGIPARVEDKNAQNELLEASYEKPEWMDTGAARATAPGNQEVEAVGTVDRAKDTEGQGRGKP